MLALGGAESLALGRASGADLLVQPLLSYGKDNWSLRMLVIDPEKADVLGAVAANLAGDQKTGPQGLAAPSQDSMARELLELTREPHAAKRLLEHVIANVPMAPSRQSRTHCSCVR